MNQFYRETTEKRETAGGPLALLPISERDRCHMYAVNKMKKVLSSAMALPPLGDDNDDLEARFGIKYENWEIMEREKDGSGWRR